MNFAFMCLDFLTTYTSIGVLLYIRLDVRPPVVPGDEFLCFVVARFRAEDKFILLSSPRVTGPTNYNEDF